LFPASRGKFGLPAAWRAEVSESQLRVRGNVLYMVFKLATRLSTNWRGINAPNQLHLLLAGYPVVDGQRQLSQPSPEEAAA